MEKKILSFDNTYANDGHDEVLIDSSAELAYLANMLKSLGYQVAEANVPEWLYGDVNAPTLDEEMSNSNGRYVTSH